MGYCMVVFSLSYGLALERARVAGQTVDVHLLQINWSNNKRITMHIMDMQSK